MAIDRQIRPRYVSRNHEIVAGLREAAGAGPPVDPKMAIKRHATQMSILMALIHGGDWTVQIGHDLRLIVIRPA